MAETTKLPDVEIMIIWNPNTGALDLKFNGSQALHVIGIMYFAAHVLASKQVEPPAIVPGSMLAHLRKQ